MGNYHSSIYTYAVAAIVLLFMTLQLSCADKQGDDYNIPDNVTRPTTGNYEQAPGTKVFIIPPAGYTALPELIRWQKDNSTYLQVIAMPGVNFVDSKANLLANIESFKQRGLVSYYQKVFMLGSDEAVFADGPSKIEGEDKMVLSFGNSSYSVMIAGVRPKGDKQALKEILASLLTAKIDMAATEDYSALATYTVDMSVSEFRFESSMSQMFTYTIPGHTLASGDSTVDQITIATMPGTEGYEARKEYAQSMLPRYETSGFVINSKEEKQVTVNGMPSYEIIMKGNENGKNVVMYQMVTGDEKATILMMGSAYSRYDDLTAQFRKVAQTLKTK